MFKQQKGEGFTQKGSALCVLCMLVALLCGFSGTAGAAAPPVKGNVSYQLNNKPLVDFLQEFFASQGLGVTVSPKVKQDGGTLNGPFTGSARSVLDKVLKTNGLIAYYDGATVFVFTAGERETRFTSLPPAKVEAFARALDDMQLGDKNDTISADASSGLVRISGTPRYVDQAQKLANTVASNTSLASTEPTEFKYYPLKYALAADTTMTVGNRQITVPGVATLLRQLVGSSNTAFAGAQERMLPQMSQGLRGQGLAATGRPPLYPPPFGNDNGSAAAQSIESVPPAAPAPGQPDVRIVADPYRNAVIVRDTRDRMPMYDQLIKQLDVSSPMVEIEATIIDVDKDKLKRYGVNWYFRNSSGHASIGFNTDAQSNPTITNLMDVLTAGTIDKLLQLTGFQAGAIIGNSAKFIARVDAMQGDGITNVITRPQVLTLNDVQAVIASTQTIYVPVKGSYSTDLYNVVAGTVLRVTPHVIIENGERHIRLVVEIQDGNVTMTDQKYADMGAIPLVTNQAVNTQAVIDPGQSLLLGGLVSDSLTNQQNKIPILGDIPFIRNLFRHVQKERDHHERLFLITPRLVNANDVTQQRTRSAPNVSVEEIYNNQQKLDHAGKSWMGKPDQLPLPPQTPPPPPAALQPPSTQPAAPQAPARSQPWPPYFPQQQPAPVTPAAEKPGH